MNREQRDRLLQELFQHATESIIVINKEGAIKLVNPATEKLFGYTQEELYEKKVEYLMPDRFTKKHVGHRDHYNQNPHSRSMGIGMDLYAKKKDGSEFPVEISLSPFIKNYSYPIKKNIRMVYIDYRNLYICKGSVFAVIFIQ